MIQSMQETVCHYLFGKEADEIYGHSKFSEEFVNQSLETMMRVNTAFLSRKENDGFCLLDPAAFNNQCHIYSYLTGTIRNGYKEKSKEEKESKTQENRYLHLSFLLAWTFMAERKLLCLAIELVSKKENIPIPENKKLFNEFVKDSNGILIRTSRKALNEVFEKIIKENFSKAKDRSPLQREFFQIIFEDLQHLSNNGKIILYTLPKIVGVAYLIHENMPIIIKTKVITRKGTDTLFYQSAPVDGDKSVLDFECIASEDFSITQFEELASGCPKYLFRKVRKADRHPNSETCVFCKTDKIDKADLKVYQKRFVKATGCLHETLYALGADFVNELQGDFMRFFQEEEKYSILKGIFQKALLDIDRLGVSMKKPLAFTVHHVYVNNARDALKPQFHMDNIPEEYLKARGFL